MPKRQYLIKQPPRLGRHDIKHDGKVYIKVEQVLKEAGIVKLFSTRIYAQVFADSEHGSASTFKFINDHHARPAIHCIEKVHAPAFIDYLKSLPTNQHNSEEIIPDHE